MFSNKATEFIKRFSIYFFVDSLNKALPFLIMLIIAAYLTTEEFGLVSNFSVIIQIAYSFIALNTYTKLSTDFYKNQESRSRLYTNLTALNVFAFLAVLFIVILLSSSLEKFFFLNIKWQIFAICIAFSMSVISLYATYLQMNCKPVLYGIVQLGQSSAFFTFCILFIVVFLWSWKGRMLSAFISYSGCAIAILIFAFYRKLIIPRLLNKKLVCEYLCWGIPLLPHALSYWLKYGTDKLIISNYVGLSDNGIYSFSLTLGSVTAIVNTSFFNTYSPYMYKKLHSYDESKDENVKSSIIKLLIRNSKWFILANAGISLFAYGILIFLIRIFVSGDYLNSIQYLPYTILTNFVGCIYSIFSGFLFYRGRTKLIGAVTFTSAILQVILNISLVPEFGVWGAIYAALSVSTIISVSILILAFKEYNIINYLRK